MNKQSNIPLPISGPFRDMNDSPFTVVWSFLVIVFYLLQAWSLGHFFSYLIFYLFGPLDSVYGTSSKITSNRLPCFILSVKNGHSDTLKFEGLA